MWKTSSYLRFNWTEQNRPNQLTKKCRWRNWKRSISEPHLIIPSGTKVRQLQFLGSSARHWTVKLRRTKLQNKCNQKENESCIVLSCFHWLGFWFKAPSRQIRRRCLRKPAC